MKRGAIIAPGRARPIRPAMACAAECALAWADALELQAFDPLAGESPDFTDIVIAVAIDFRQLVEMVEPLRAKLPKSSIVVGFVFDAFFSRRLEALPAAIRRGTGLIRGLRRFQAIYSPVAQLIDRQARDYDIPLRYMPIGVDCVQFGQPGHVPRRFVTVNGYGRQPPALVERLADDLNRGDRGFFHFTSHAEIGMLTDAVRHRDHFWQLLRRSRIALAYAPEAYDPYKRFPCSFVGQRWYESLAAGCAIAGKRPVAPEAATLLDWPDATIELPDDPEEATRFLLALAADEPRLEEISRANFQHCLVRHDWRVRARQIVADFPQVFQDGSNILAKIDATIEHAAI